MQTAIDKYGVKSLLVAMLVIGSLLRIGSALLTKGHGHDLFLFGDWGASLKFHRTDEFYYVARAPDHLPGDLWFHWILSASFQSFGGSHYWGVTYYFLLRMVPSVADVLVALLLFSIVRQLVSAKAGLLAAAMYFLNPAIGFVSSAWGQWDSVSMVLVLAGLAIVIHRPERWIWCVPLIAWATVVKPPLALPGILIIAMPLMLMIRKEKSTGRALRGIVPSILACAVLGLSTILLICMPFSIGLPGMSTNWTIVERAQIALDLYPFKTLAAANFWMLQTGSFDHVPDTAKLWIGLNAHDLGNVYLGLSFIVVALVFVYLVFVRMSDQPYLALLWSLTAVTFATYMVPTRVHERYVFPSVVLLIVFVSAANIGRNGWILVCTVSATFLANLVFVYYGFHEGFTERYGDGAFSFLLRATSVLNILAFIAIALAPLILISDHPPAKTRPGVRPMPASGTIRDLPAS